MPDSANAIALPDDIDWLGEALGRAVTSPHDDADQTLVALAETWFMLVVSADYPLDDVCGIRLALASQVEAAIAAVPASGLEGVCIKAWFALAVAYGGAGGRGALYDVVVASEDRHSMEVSLARHLHEDVLRLCPTIRRMIEDAQRASVEQAVRMELVRQAMRAREAAHG